MALDLPHLIQLYSCLFMTGVIWIVQVLVYPNFHLVEENGFGKFHQFHQNRITWVVAPMMTLELASGAWVLYFQPSVIYVVNILSIILLWAITAFVAVPIHNQLERNHLERRDALIFWNWLRTFIWTVRSLIWVFVILPGVVL